jgi:hypothetical protein
VPLSSRFHWRFTLENLRVIVHAVGLLDQPIRLFHLALAIGATMTELCRGEAVRKEYVERRLCRQEKNRSMGKTCDDRVKTYIESLESFSW